MGKYPLEPHGYVTGMCCLLQGCGASRLLQMVTPGLLEGLQEIPGYPVLPGRIIASVIVGLPLGWANLIVHNCPELGITGLLHLLHWSRRNIAHSILSQTRSHNGTLVIGDRRIVRLHLGNLLDSGHCGRLNSGRHTGTILGSWPTLQFFWGSSEKIETVGLGKRKSPPFIHLPSISNVCCCAS